MLTRALELRAVIGRFITSWANEDVRFLMLSPTEWRQVEYLIELTWPFYDLTLAVSKMNGPSVHRVFEIYNAIFDHLDDRMERLKSKRAAWKIQLRDALSKAHDKLRTYYAKTYESQGFIYAIATILYPGAKLKCFKTQVWQDTTKNWHDTYEKIFHKVFQYYSDRNPNIKVQSGTYSSVSTLDRALARSKHRHLPSSTTSTYREIQTYLTEGNVPSNIISKSHSIILT